MNVMMATITVEMAVPSSVLLSLDGTAQGGEE